MKPKNQEKQELAQARAPEKTAEIIANKPTLLEKDTTPPAHHEDKRATARQENVHFTNRAPSKGQ